MAKRNRDMLKVDKAFKASLSNLQRDLSRRRGHDIKMTDLTAELATKNFDRFMLKVLSG